MKVSYNWLRELLDLDMDREALSGLLTSLGLEVEGVEAYESIKGGLEGVVVGKVADCKPHPNADRLSLCKVDTGDGENLSIVCGAPNVASGQTVLVAKVGSELYMPDGEALEIRRAKIRGEVSEGMICAEDELGLGDGHEGVMVLDDKWGAGTPASEVFSIYHDTVYDIGLTPNRSDATHHTGVARDVIAALKVREEQTVGLHEPTRVELKERGQIDGFPVEVESFEACPRYSGLIFNNIVVGESPEWLKNRLAAIGVRPINNVVDATNLILHEMGQPLHAFDLDKVGKSGIRVGFKEEDTPFVTLDKIERRLHEEDLMICNGKGVPLCIGGVFGGTGTGVTDETTSIFLESAHFDPTHIRRTSTRHDLRTDAARVFEKGSDPSITVKALERAAYLLTELAGAEIAGPVVDLYDRFPQRTRVRLEFEYLNKLSGHEFPAPKVRTICEALGIEIASEDPSGVDLLVTTDKMEVTRPADVVEEILRVYGYDRIEFGDKLALTLLPAEYPDENRQRNQMADLLNGFGFHQMMNLSLSQSRYYPGRKDLVYILNTSNTHLDIMRPDMLVSGLEVIAYNRNRQQEKIKLFEFGKMYQRDGEKYIESSRLSLFVCGPMRKESWMEKGREADYYYLKGVLGALLDKLGIDDFELEEEDRDDFAYGLRLVLETGHEAGYLGCVAAERLEAFDLEKEVFFLELDWNRIRKMAVRDKVHYSEISKYPAVRRDIAVVLDRNIEYDNVADLIRGKAGEILQQVNLFDIYINEEQLGKDKKSYAVSMVFERLDRTLTDKEVDKVTDRIVKGLKKTFNARLR